MAKTIDEFPRRTRKGIYPWRKWSDGRVWKARYGQDFQCEPRSFMVSVYTYAYKHGLTVKVRSGQRDPDNRRVVIFQFSR